MNAVRPAKNDYDDSPGPISTDKTGVYFETVSWRKKLVVMDAVLHAGLAALVALVRATAGAFAEYLEA